MAYRWILGHARIFLYAIKNIKEGDTLFYDYNAGGFDEYPTNEFVWYISINRV